MLAKLLSPLDAKSLHVALMFAALSALCNRAAADRFGEWFDIEFVTIGDPGNPPDSTGNGSVGYVYRIGKYEISGAMVSTANRLGGLGITQRSPGGPGSSISWFEAATFVNWLNTSSGYREAYNLDAFTGDMMEWPISNQDPANPSRNRSAKYFLPTDAEWTKAAYYDPRGVYFDFPTGCDCKPIPVSSGTAPCTAVYDFNLAHGPAGITQAGGLSPYGTMAQGGNVEEWLETQIIGPSSIEYLTAGATYADISPDLKRPGKRRRATALKEFQTYGFRVASRTPEPSSLLLGVVGALGLLLRRRSVS